MCPTTADGPALDYYPLCNVLVLYTIAAKDLVSGVKYSVDRMLSPRRDPDSHRKPLLDNAY